MTTVIAWLSADMDGPSALYLASDSRFTWNSPDGRWDSGRKIFHTRNSADIFAYVGDVLFPSIVLGQLVEAIDCGGAFSVGTTSADRHDFIFRTIEKSHASMIDVGDQPITILHARRDPQTDMFAMWEMTHRKGTNGWTDRSVPLPQPTGQAEFVGVFGSGAKTFGEAYDQAKTTAQGEFARTVFQTFSEHVASGRDKLTGGHVQGGVVGRDGQCRPIGVIDKGRRYLFGLELPPGLQTNRVDWRDTNFNFLSSRTGELKKGARPYVRDRKK